MTRALSTDGWVAEVKAHGLVNLAALGGVSVSRSGRDIWPCPACGAKHRGHADRKGPVGISPDGQGWRCFRPNCGAGGDCVAFACWIATDRDPKTLDRDGWRYVRDWCADRGLCTPAVGAAPPFRCLVRPTPRRKGLAPHVRPPAQEVRALWGAASSVDKDPAVAAWLQSRALTARRSGWIVDRDLARALPPSAELPSWCRFQGRPWSETGHRLVVSMFGPTGCPESLRARNIFLDCPPGEKAAAPAGFAVAGLCMADPLARLVLQDGAAPSWWHGPLRIVVAEGEADFLTWATHFSDADEEARAVIGVVAGSWTPEIAARVPDGSRVVIRTHADEAGDRYADRIAETLTGRCILQRPRRPEG